MKGIGKRRWNLWQAVIWRRLCPQTIPLEWSTTDKTKQEKMSFLSMWRKSSQFDKITKSKSWKLKSGKGKHIHCNDNVKELLCNKVSLQTFEVSDKGKWNITTSNQRKYLPRFGVTFSSCFFQWWFVIFIGIFPAIFACGRHLAFGGDFRAILLHKLIDCSISL